MADIPNYLQGQDQVLYGERLNQSLQESISDNGFVTPSQSTASITNLASIMPNGTLWYDENTNQLKAKVGDSVVVVQVV